MCLILGNVRKYQISGSKVGVCLILGCVLYLGDYGKRCSQHADFTKIQKFVEWHHAMELALSFLSLSVSLAIGQTFINQVLEEVESRKHYLAAMSERTSGALRTERSRGPPQKKKILFTQTGKKRTLVSLPFSLCRTKTNGKFFWSLVAARHISHILFPCFAAGVSGAEDYGRGRRNSVCNESPQESHTQR